MGAVTRAFVRAEALLWSAKALARPAPQRGPWRQKSPRPYPADSWERWSEEDSPVYHRLARGLLRYADGLPDLLSFNHVTTRLLLSIILQPPSPTVWYPNSAFRPLERECRNTSPASSGGGGETRRGDLKWGAQGFRDFPRAAGTARAPMVFMAWRAPMRTAGRTTRDAPARRQERGGSGRTLLEKDRLPNRLGGDAPSCC
jgi:hypothetical protein